MHILSGYKFLGNSMVNNFILLFNIFIETYYGITNHCHLDFSAYSIKTIHNNTINTIEVIWLIGYLHL